MLATWNIVDRPNAGLQNAAKGVADSGIGCAFLTEVKIVGDKHVRRPEGYEMIMSRRKSKHQGGVALMWRDMHPQFEIENVNGCVRNLITFRIKTGEKPFYNIAI